MSQYIIRRLLLIPVILFGVTVLIFGMLSMLEPAERAALYVHDIPKNAQVMDSIIKRYGLDDPFFVQYWHWLTGTRDIDTGEIEGGIIRGGLWVFPFGKHYCGGTHRKKVPGNS